MVPEFGKKKKPREELAHLGSNSSNLEKFEPW